MRLRLTLLLLLLSYIAVSQNQEWGSYFSYTNVTDMAQNSARVYASSESALFSQNTVSGELNTVTSVDGLKAEGITAMLYSPSTQRLLVGNSNGLLLVMNPDGSIATKVDIVQEANIVNTSKKINHILEHNGIAYLSCDFGIVLFNVSTLQFGDTYFLGNQGTHLVVNQCAVHNEYLYAATTDGLRRALVNHPNLNDYNAWAQMYVGNWTGVLSYNNNLFANAAWNAFIRINDDISNVTFATPPSALIDLREASGYMVATCATRVYVFDRNLQQAYQINTVGEPATFTCATVVGQRVYVGTQEKGVFSIELNSFSVLNITPNGPLRSNIFSLEKTPGALWAVYGGYTFDFEPWYQTYGVSKYQPNTGWTNIPYNTLSSVNGVVREVQDINGALANPANEKQVYFFSSNSGLLRMEDMVSTTLFNTGNSALEREQKTNSASIRTYKGAFDTNGNLWVTNGRTKNALKVLRGSQWSSYSFENIVGTGQTADIEYGKLVIDRNGTKWIPTYNVFGLIAFNENLNNKFIRITDDNGLPSNHVKCVALDNGGRLWIGTISGLRVIYSTERFLTEDTLEAQQVIIMEDGVAQELMYEQTITDIEVDGSNNKWIATSAGAFLVSPDGQQTLYHFTKENSPLPSNTINDIAIDNITGEVFFATDKGMVSFKGSSTSAKNDLKEVYVYPNPVRPNFNGDVKITNLTDNANVKITDIEGNLVYETTSEGGTVLWDTTAFGKYKVRSGVYMVFIATEDATETTVKKIMVVRGN